jgi:hypothetical protein
MSRSLQRLLLSSLLLTGSSALAAGTWEVRPSLPFGKAECFATKWNGSIHIVGGSPWRNGGDQDGSVFQMNANGTWTEVAALDGMGPTVDQEGGVDSQNRIIVFGGHTIPEADTGLTKAYLPSEGCIETLPDGYVLRYNNLSSAVDGQHRIYRIAGGEGQYGMNVSFCSRFDGTTGLWENVASVPYARASMATAYDGQGNIWGFGGWTSAGVWRIPDTVRYNVATNSWTSVGSAYLPIATADATAVLGADGKIYMIGGTTDAGITTNVWVLNPSTQTLSPGPSLNVGRSDFGAALGDDKFIYVIGGYTNSGTMQSVERLYTGNCPAIGSQSGSASVDLGATLILNAAATGDAPLTFQWKRNGVPLVNGPTGNGSTVAGATTNTLTITSIAAADAGSYTFSATNPCSTVTGNGITVTVNGTIPGDYNLDGHVNGSDLAVLLGAWGTVAPTIDLTGNGIVDGADLAVFLGAWG